MSARTDVTRRGFLGVVATGAAASACSGGDDAGAGGADDRPTHRPGEYQESPTLTERVESGDLPPLTDRIPDEPYVVQPGSLIGSEYVDTQQGTYGGTLQLAQDSPNGDPTIFIGLNEPLLWAPNGFEFSEGIEANVLAGFEANADDTAFTFHLRQGMKWSDGEPVTIEDVRFAFDDVLFNEEITPIFPAYLRGGRRSDAAPAELEVIDEWTFSLSFDRPYGTFPSQLAIADWISYGDIIKPRHYLEQFHAKYADAADLDELIAAESLPENQWFLLFDQKQMTGWLWDTTTELGLGHPTLCPWVLSEVSGDVFTYQRNPYYFKVDAEGKQLPYIDAIRSQTVQDKETLTSRALFGEFDFLGERASARQLSLIAEKANAEEIQLWIYPKHTILTSFFFNLTYPDDTWQQVVRDVRFRRALDLAINREEIVEIFFLGEFAEIPSDLSDGTYDTAEANRLLDEMGLDERDADGFRIGPDGETFVVPFELHDHAEETIPTGELLAEYWNDLGVRTTVRTIDTSVANERMEVNDLQAGTRPLAYPIWGSAGWFDYLPSIHVGPLWQEWYDTQGESGEEPPDEVRELFDLHGDLMSEEVGSPEFNQVLEQIVANHAEHVWNVNPVERMYLPTFWTSRIKNVPQGRDKGDLYGIIATFSMEQWYIEE